MAATAVALLRRARWALVDHPAVASFAWQPGRTLAAAPSFAGAVVCAYLAAVLLLHRRVVPLPALPARALRAVSALHNAVLLALSAAMAAGCALSVAATAPSRWWAFCFPPGGATAASGPVFFWAHVFYLSKVYELGDTLLILLGRRPLTLLHVYHHAVVIVMCYLWLATRQSLMPIALATNATVHVVMYGYYLCCSLGLRWPPRWKRAVTELQIAQFLFSFAASVVMLWRHFAAGGCEGMGGWLFNAVFNASLLALFLDFHGAAYAAAKGKKKSRSEVVKGD
ncbi:elongation of fatty acids protein 3-like [Oryza brachyantha]|uniref:elongation of fatty acids protein 3-like n=1 Tax=Oryza brachyantha TaxID=4533 RepID=UPI001ADCDF37|nr:elongation of fatty acids protein 3-like [Oryza brachyantha]